MTAAAYAYRRRKQKQGIRVRDLPKASTVGRGHMMFVTDATSATAGDTVTGGGALRVRVVSDRTNWLVK